MELDDVTSELTVNITPRNRANLRRLKTNSIQSFQRWEKENELLYAMIEDESGWISNLFPDAIITPDFFFYALEDGTLLCRLANYIQEMANAYGERLNKKIPGKILRYHQSKRGNREPKLFHSRDNVQKFLIWCRCHNIPEAILFESNDVVLVDECRTGGREIVICLMEIARRAVGYEITEVPRLIQLEQEIDEEEANESEGSVDDQSEQGQALDTNSVNIESRGDKSPIDSDSGVDSVFEEGDHPSSPRFLQFTAEESDSKYGLAKQTRLKPDPKKDSKKSRKEHRKDLPSLLEDSHPKTELDKKVCKIAENYNIKLVHRLKEGKYIILGKIMFVRMLNDHMLVRIGGGWDTLEHYIMTHAPKPTSAEGQGSSTPQGVSLYSRSSGVWSKLVDKIKRRESQPELSVRDSPVVISKGDRPESSPLAYRLRDRVRKKLSVTEKDKKDISNAIRKIESNISQTDSPSFTTKTFFQLKNRFDKRLFRRGSRDSVTVRQIDNMAETEMDMNGVAADLAPSDVIDANQESEVSDTSEVVQSKVTTETLIDDGFESQTITTTTEHTFSEVRGEEAVGDLLFMDSQVTVDTSQQAVLESSSPELTEASVQIDELLSFESQPQEQVQFDISPPAAPHQENETDETFEPLQPLILDLEAPKFEEKAEEDVDEETNLIQVDEGQTYQNVDNTDNTEILEPEAPNSVGEIEQVVDEETKLIQVNEAQDEQDVNNTAAVEEATEATKVGTSIVNESPETPVEETSTSESVEALLKEASFKPEETAVEPTLDIREEEQPSQEESMPESEEEPQSAVSVPESVEECVKEISLEAEAPKCEEQAPAVEPELGPEPENIETREDSGGAELTPPEPELVTVIHSEFTVVETTTRVSYEETEPEPAPAALEETAKSEGGRDAEPTVVEPQESPEEPAEHAMADEVPREELQTENAEAPPQEVEGLVSSVEVEKKEVSPVAGEPKPEVEEKVEEVKVSPTEKPKLKTAAGGTADKTKPQAKSATQKTAPAKKGPAAAKKEVGLPNKAEKKPEKPKSSAPRPSTVRNAAAKTSAAAKHGSTSAGTKPTGAKRPASAQPGRVAATASKAPATKTATRPASAVKKAPSSTTATKPAGEKEKKPTRPASVVASRAAKPAPASKTRPQSASASKPGATDQTDSKGVHSARPQNAKPKPTVASTTKTTITKKSTVLKTSNRVPAKSEVTKTTPTTSKDGGTTSKTTTVKKTIDASEKTKAKSATPPPKATAARKIAEQKSGKMGTAAAKTKTGAARPKSPKKAPLKKIANGDKKAPEKAQTPAEIKPEVVEASAETPTDVESDSLVLHSTELSPESVVTKEVVQRSHIETTEDGVTKTVVTREVTETVVENGEEHTTTMKEIIVDDGGEETEI